MSASKPAGGGLDAQAAEATTGGVNAIAEVPDAGAACGATAEGLGAPPVELSHGSRSPAQAAGLASRCALILASKVSGSVSPLAARSLIVKRSSEDGIRFMSNLLPASYLTGRSKSKTKTGAFVRHLHLVQPTARVRQRVRQRLGLLRRSKTDGPEHSPTSAGRGLLRPRRHRELWGWDTRRTAEPS